MKTAIKIAALIAVVGAIAAVAVTGTALASGEHTGDAPGMMNANGYMHSDTQGNQGASCPMNDASAGDTNCPGTCQNDQSSNCTHACDQTATRTQTHCQGCC